MPNEKRDLVRLSDQEREQIATMMNRGRHLATHVKRAWILKLLDQRNTVAEVMRTVGCSRTTATTVIESWKQGGLQQVFTDKKRPGRPPKLDAKAQAVVVELVASQPPEGRARWTHELVQLELSGLQIAQTVSAKTIGRVLKKTK